MDMTPPLELADEDRALLMALLARHLPGVTVWAFGSRVQGNARPASDLDLVLFTPPGQSGAVGSLREALDESDLPFRVDPLVWEEIPDRFHRAIRARHVVLQEGS